MSFSDTIHEKGEKRPTIALMGEFSAGKTTLINFLLGDDVLPTRVTATQLPPVWMSYGERSAFFVDEEGNETPIEIEDLATVGVEGVRYIRLFADTGILSEIDLIDTPGISDPNIPLHFRSFVAETADALLWCTHATQAWRESERSALDSMPKNLLKHSVLLATRSDKLGVQERRRVRDRLIRETEGRFANIIMFSAVEAIEACEQESEGELWTKSGGDELLKTLHHLSIAINDPDAPRMELGMFATEEPEAPQPAAAQSAETLEDVLVLNAPVPEKPAGAPAPKSATAGGAVLPRRVRRKETSRPLRKEEATAAKTPSEPLAPDNEVAEGSKSELVLEVTTDTPEPKAEEARSEKVELTLVRSNSEVEPDAAADEAAEQAIVDELAEVETQLAPPSEEAVEEPSTSEIPAVEISDALITSLSEQVTEGEDAEPAIEVEASASEEDIAPNVEEEKPQTAIEAWQAFRDQRAPETMEELDALVAEFLKKHSAPEDDGQSDTADSAGNAWRLYV